MNDPFDIHNARARATNARKTPLYVGQEADELRILLARLVGAAAFLVPVGVLLAVWFKP